MTSGLQLEEPGMVDSCADSCVFGFFQIPPCRSAPAAKCLYGALIRTAATLGR